jgi:hypothetical protein
MRTFATNRYLDAVMNLSYTLLRMLEKYSKSKSYMYVRKKAGRAAKKRKKSASFMFSLLPSPRSLVSRAWS